MFTILLTNTDFPNMFSTRLFRSVLARRSCLSILVFDIVTNLLGGSLTATFSNQGHCYTGSQDQEH